MVIDKINKWWKDSEFTGTKPTPVRLPFQYLADQTMKSLDSHCWSSIIQSYEMHLQYIYSTYTIQSYTQGVLSCHQKGHFRQYTLFRITLNRFPSSAHVQSSLSLALHSIKYIKKLTMKTGGVAKKETFEYYEMLTTFSISTLLGSRCPCKPCNHIFSLSVWFSDQGMGEEGSTQINFPCQ
jgi:hypothetical protein